VRLKWPNDLLGPSGKLGGVLAEASLADEAIEHAILGIGLNVNLSRKALAQIPGADSLQASLRHPIARNALARALLQALDDRYAALRRGQVEAVLAEWRERLETTGQWVSLRRGGVAEGPFFARDVTESGALVLEGRDGTSFEVVAGEVWVRAATTEGVSQ
jgi:BirA family biotin operon repressor/biotin-[acetyl-CoA-carboxylase] ligase